MDSMDHVKLGAMFWAMFWHMWQGEWLEVGGIFSSQSCCFFFEEQKGINNLHFSFKKKYRSKKWSAYMVAVSYHILSGSNKSI